MSGLDGGESFLVPVNPEIGRVPALQHDLGGPERLRLAAAAQDLLERVGPALGVLGSPVEGTELAGGDADVGVVDVAIDDVRRDLLGSGKLAAPHRVRGATELVQRRVD